MIPRIPLPPPAPYQIAVRPFNLAEALAGAPFILDFQARRADAARCVSRIIVRLDHADHPAILAHCGEWLVYDDSAEGLATMNHDLRLVDVSGDAAKEAA